MSLDAFFDAMAPMLSGRTDAGTVVNAIGPSDSGAESLGFYNELIRRNHAKLLGDIFIHLHGLMERESPGTWETLIAGYRLAHPAAHWDPNLYAEHFSSYLREQREAGAALHPIYEELADFAFVRQRAFFGNQTEGDAYEQRIFVRQYTHPLSDYLPELHHNPDAPIPAARPQVVIVYRHARDHSLHNLLPTAAGLAAVARRQGMTQLPPMFASLREEDIAAADQALVERGLFTERTS
ncbi:MAG: hypothetical protein AAGA54_15810 [Myxococcota bacterium]